MEIEPELMSIFCNHFELGKNDVFEYIRFLKQNNQDELISILKKYGTPEADINKFEKQLKNVK